MIKMLAAMCLLAFGAVSHAATYVYQGLTFDTIVTGTTYTTSMRITGSFTTAAPLPANMGPTDIGPDGTNLVLTWSFNDGVNTYTPANSYVVPGTGFGVGTDASGNVLATGIGIFSPLPPHALGTPVNGIYVAIGDAAVTGAPCSALTGTICTNANGPIATGGYATRNARGTFTRAADVAMSVPSLSAWSVLVLAAVLGLAMMIGLRRSGGVRYFGRR